MSYQGQTYDLFGTTMSQRETEALDFLDIQIEKYEPNKVLALFSGGTDSLASTLLASKHPAFSGVVHLNTGIGIKKTRRFVKETCLERGWELHERYPPGKQITHLVTQFGMAGWGMHSYYYRYLKDHALAQLCRKMRGPLKGGARPVMLVSGARSQESRRRMANARPVTTDINGTAWVNPLLSWSKAETRAYANSEGVQQNEVSQHLHISGECLCGAAAKPGELELIRAFYPAEAEEIDWLCSLARKAGKHDVWGVNPPFALKQYANSPSLWMPLCIDCEPEEQLTTELRRTREAK